MSHFFDDTETRSPAERENEYSRKLSHMISLGYEHSERVRDTFDTLGLKPADVRSVTDLEKLPVISREQVIDFELQNLPYGGFCRTDADIDRIFTSPGPVYEPHLTEKDPLWRRGYSAAGFGKGDIVLNTFSYHMVAAGLTFHEGLRAVGATVVPSGTSSTEIQVQLIKHLKVTGYTGTPSFLMAIITKAEEMGHDVKKDFTIQKASFVAEPLQPSLRKKFEEEYGIDTYQMYGATEVGDIAYECSEKSGWHICEEVIVEIVDPASGKSVEPGQLGEVVVTRLNDIFFLFRFGTGDLSTLTEEACPCGRTSYKMNGIAGRVGDAVKVRGLFIAPSQLNIIKEYFNNTNYQLVITRESYRDYVTAIIEAGKDEHQLAERFDKHFQSICTVKIDAFKLVAPGSISDSDKILIDKRSWE
jgi:phenylacetate-CoA ligase